jgi:hypothetical protein
MDEGTLQCKLPVSVHESPCVGVMLGLAPRAMQHAMTCWLQHLGAPWAVLTPDLPLSLTHVGWQMAQQRCLGGLSLVIHCQA